MDCCASRLATSLDFKTTLVGPTGHLNRYQAPGEPVSGQLFRSFRVDIYPSLGRLSHKTTTALPLRLMKEAPSMMAPHGFNETTRFKHQPLTFEELKWLEATFGTLN